jgi:nucleoside-diphosphate-sugar epimerase
LETCDGYLSSSLFCARCLETSEKRKERIETFARNLVSVDELSLQGFHLESGRKCGIRIQMPESDCVINRDDRVLITGATGFIGLKLTETLLKEGFKNLTCFVRPSSNEAALHKIIDSTEDIDLEIIRGNLLSRNDCEKATKGTSVVYHLAAATGEKSFAGAYMNSVVGTRNLLDAILKCGNPKRFVNVSSFSVYSNVKLRPGALLDETCEVENEPESRHEAYCYAKVKQDELVMEYGRKHHIPYVIVRPGVVYGPGKKGLTGRVGIDTFGVFLHMGGSNRIPLTYVDNCAYAIVLSGMKRGIDGEVFNVVDDNPPRSREFLKLYKKNVHHFRSLYVPKTISYVLCYLWEKYSEWSGGQLPPVYNRKRWSADWKGNRYSNEKLKRLLGWTPQVSFDEGAKKYFEYCRTVGR